MELISSIVKIVLIVLSFGFRVNAHNLICYYSNAAFNNGGLSLSSINATLCSHFVYSYASIDSTTYKITSTDPNNDINNGGYTKFTGLKSQTTEGKFLLALGSKLDSVTGSRTFSALVSDPSRIQTMVNSTLSYLKLYGFEGLSVDWIFPNTTDDFKGYSNLLMALKTAFKDHGYLLASSVSAMPWTIPSYNGPVMNQTLDLVLLMAFDYHTANLEPDTARHHAPLYTPTNDPEMATMNANHSVHLWVQKGLSRSLLHLGIPLYANGWSVRSTTSNPPSPPVAAFGPPSRVGGSKGPISFGQVCSLIKGSNLLVNEPNSYSGPWFTVINSTSHKEGNVSYVSSDWYGYDDLKMASTKAEYVLKNNLGGAMLWDISQDDINNDCGYGTNSFTKNMSIAIKCIVIEEPETSTTTSTTTTPTTISSTIVPTNASVNTPTTVSTIASTTLTTLQSTTVHQNLCPTKNAVFPDATSCHKFNVCLNGTVYGTECPFGQYFNANILHCDDDPNNVKCPVKKQSKKSESLSYDAVKYDWKVNY